MTLRRDINTRQNVGQSHVPRAGGFTRRLAKNETLWSRPRIVWCNDGAQNAVIVGGKRMVNR